MSRLSISEGFDIFINRLRYVKYYILALVVVPLTTFLSSFAYFVSKDANLKLIILDSLKYGLFNLRDYFFRGLIKYKKGPDYYYYQEIYTKYLHQLFHTHAFYYSVAFSPLILVLMFFLIKEFTKRLSDKTVLRGTRIKNLGTVSNLRKLIKPKDEIKHTMIIGATGFGKTQAMYKLSNPVVYSCKNIFFDAKGDSFPAFFRKGIDVLINPLDIRSARWNFLEEVEDISDIDVLAEAFVSPDRGNFVGSKSDYFQRNAKFILSAIFKELYENGIVENDRIREIILKEVFYKSQQGIISDLIERMNVGSNVSFADTLSTLRVSLDFIKVLGFEPKSNTDFSIDEWLNSEDNANIFITTRKDKSSITRGFNTAFLSMLLLKLEALPDVKSPNDVRVRIWIDELANLSRIPHLAEALSFLRSKGVAIYISTQSLEGLKRVYKEHEIKDILNNCSNLFCFGVNDEYTANVISKLIGEQQIEVALKNNFSTPKVSNIDGISLTHTRSTEYAVLPAEIMALEDLEFFAKLKKRWYKGKLKYTPIRKREDIEFFMMNRALLIKELRGEIGCRDDYAGENNNLSSKSNINPNFKPNLNSNSNLNSSSNHNPNSYSDSTFKPESDGGVSLDSINNGITKGNYRARTYAGNSKTGKISNERLAKDEAEISQTNSKQDNRKEEKANPLSMIDELID